MYHLFLTKRQEKNKELPKDKFRVFQHKLSCFVSSVCRNNLWSILNHNLIIVQLQITLQAPGV